MECIPRDTGPLAKAPKQRDFDMVLFAKWLRMILVSFYNDEEIIIADFLLQRAAQMEISFIAHRIGLGTNQLWKILEKRLVPDCIVEKTVEGEMKSAQGFFRISRLCVAVAAKRLQAMENSLMEQTHGDYYCPECQKSYTTLEAMAKASKTDKSFRFLCEKCNVDLDTTADIAEQQRESLNTFITRHQELLLLTRDLAGLTAGSQEMVIPFFPRPKLSRKRTSKQDAAHMASDGNLVAKPGEEKGPNSVEHNESSSSSAVPTGADIWFSTEVLDELPDVEHVSASTTPGTFDNSVLEKAQSQKREEFLRRSRKQLASSLASSVEKTTVTLEPELVIAGVKRKLGEIRGDEGLLDSMTDDEYQRWFTAERKFQRDAESKLIRSKIQEQRLRNG